MEEFTSKWPKLGFMNPELNKRSYTKEILPYLF